MSMNGFRRVVHILYPLFLISPATDIAHAHNQLLQTGLDLGLPGLVAYLALWWISAVLLWRSWRGAPDTAHRALVVGVAGALVASWIFGLLDAISLGAKPGFMWWLLLALLVALHDRSRPETAASPSGSR
jgi:putative inorganic carbon (HCO3(-)) transporter